MLARVSPGPRRLGDGEPLGEVGAQCLVPALVRLGRRGEELRAGGRFRCHEQDLPERRADRPRSACAHVLPRSA